jgi:hypothetical protein
MALKGQLMTCTSTSRCRKDIFCVIALCYGIDGRRPLIQRRLREPTVGHLAAKSHPLLLLMPNLEEDRDRVADSFRESFTLHNELPIPRAPPNFSYTIGSFTPNSEP